MLHGVVGSKRKTFCCAHSALGIKEINFLPRRRKLKTLKALAGEQRRVRRSTSTAGKLPYGAHRVSVKTVYAPYTACAALPPERVVSCSPKLARSNYASPAERASDSGGAVERSPSSLGAVEAPGEPEPFRVVRCSLQSGSHRRGQRRRPSPLPLYPCQQVTKQHLEVSCRCADVAGMQNHRSLLRVTVSRAWAFRDHLALRRWYALLDVRRTQRVCAARRRQLDLRSLRSLPRRAVACDGRPHRPKRLRLPNDEAMTPNGRCLTPSAANRVLRRH